MKPWAKWMINHNLRYMVLFCGLLSLFVVVPIALFDCVYFLSRDIKAEFKAMMSYPKETK